ncbi:hypothetical protein QMM96_22070 [Citrobacter freundii]|uniref:hypothetical protein n=1 Tax=Citrobacter freundii TaxID=546 RepID=UPI002B240BA0|nr:hypothetical protein [Citrobacter freundii]MEB2478119.1 hypothetical protein [Citrobacter freundii]
MKAKLTNAQIYTLRRMNTGTKYTLRGDGKKAEEQRPTVAVERGQWFRTTDPCNAPSVPVLHRMGLVEFIIDRGQEPNKFYRVQLTDKGREAAETLQIAEKD